MAPAGRPNEVPAQVNPRHAGVLVLLYPVQGALRLVLTLRAQGLAKHQGQVSFPGGRAEAGDASHTHTALREAREELGVALADAEVLGTLSPLYVPPSNFIIHPTVAHEAVRPQFAPQQSEVAEIIEVPLAALLDERNIGGEPRSLPSQNGVVQLTPHYLLMGHKVWGATAMVLAEFAHMLKALPKELGCD